MNKEQIVAALAQKTGATKRESEYFFEGVVQVISEALAAGHKVQIVGFGTFEVRERAPRVGRNPHANKPVQIPAKQVPYFTPGKGLKDLVEQSRGNRDKR